MSETKFTPGPWHIDGHCQPWEKGLGTWDEVGAGIGASDPNNPVVIGGCQDEQGGAVGIARTEDAYLISASPDLYAALDCWPLKALLGWIEDCGSTVAWEHARLFIEVRDAALAKARGEA